MRAAYRQPIYLAKLKKRDKQNAVVQEYRQIDSIQYDLMLFQESLHLKDQPKNDLYMTMRSNSLSKKPLGENLKVLNQTGEMRNTNMEKQKNSKCDNLSRSTAPIFQKCVFNKSNFQFKNVHKTQASTKPRTKSIAETCLNIIQNKNQSIQLSYVKIATPNTNSNIAQSKIKGIVQKMANFQPLKQQSLAKNDQRSQQSSELMKKVYQKKIEQLQQLNKKNIEIIKRLQQVNYLHQNQNAHLLQRIEHIQHEFDQLLAHHNSLKDLQVDQEIATQVTALKFFSEQYSQTEPTIEIQSRQQSFNKNKNHSSRSSLQLSNEDWIIRAKQLKNQLQLQKIYSLNLQASYKIMLQNKQIEWRQKMDAMQRQIQGLNTRFERKCTEVKQKQQLITRLIQK